jgi:hypothetical protein
VGGEGRFIVFGSVRDQTPFHHLGNALAVNDRIATGIGAVGGLLSSAA